MTGLPTAVRLLGLVVALNLVRYLVGGPIEGVTIMEPMHAAFAHHPEVYDADFTTADFAVSLGYNFGLWLAAAVVFHLMAPSLPGPWLVKSLAGYGVMAGFFIALAAVYMNHYVEPFRAFYRWSMVDAGIVFGVVAVANALLYPRLFPERVRAG